jgi:hypothetical protein
MKKGTPAHHRVRSSCFASLLASFCLFATTQLPKPVEAQDTQLIPRSREIFESTKHKIRFLYPSQMQQYETDHEHVITAFAAVDPATKRRSYPSFNVVVRPGTLEAGALEAFEENVLAEYNQIGLTSVKPVFGHELLFNGTQQHGPYVQLEYRSKGETFTADVAAVPGEDRHFILTYLDWSVAYQENKSLRDLLFTSFEVVAPPTPPVETRTMRESNVDEPLIPEDIKHIEPARSATPSSFVAYDNNSSFGESPTKYALILVLVIGVLALFASGRSKNSL